MAKFLPTLAVEKSFVLNGNMYYLAPLKAAVLQSANNNRRNIGKATTGKAKNASPAFDALDSQITHLDASYDLLTNQPDWVTWAVEMEGYWDLCANCAPEASGKKIFRQLNFNRSVLGLPALTTPPAFAPPAGLGDLEVNWASHQPPGFNFVLVTCSVSGPGYGILQAGLVDNNPVLDFTGTVSGIFFEGTAEYDYWTTLVLLVAPTVGQDTTAKLCWMGIDGVPGRSEPTYWFHN